MNATDRSSSGTWRSVAALLLAVLAASVSLSAPPSAPGSAAPPKKGKRAAAPTRTPVPVATPPPVARVSVQQVNDRRGSGPFAHLSVPVELADVPSGDVAFVRVVLRRAVDDRGNDLIPESREVPHFEPTIAAAPAADGSAPIPLALTLALKNPPREATALREVTAEVELLMPAKDPNSVADVKDFLEAPGRLLPSPALAASSVQLSVLGPAQLQEEKKKAVAKATADAKKKKATPEMLKFIAETAAENFVAPEEGELVLSPKDPEGRLESFTLVTPAGEEKSVSASTRQGYLVLSTMGEKPGPGWTLRIRLKTEKSYARWVLSLRDIPLP